MATLLASTLVGVGLGSAAQADTASDTTALFNATNADRAASGLGPLTFDPAAAQIAQTWLQQMAASGGLAHNPNLAAQVTAQVTPYWTRIGENVGYAGDPSWLESTFMASGPHRANILGDYNRVGIATVRVGSTLWAVLDFIKGPPLVDPSSPIGNLESLSLVPGGVAMSGWALDPDTSNPITIYVFVDGNLVAGTTASSSRPDVGSLGHGTAHGYALTIPVPGGGHQICVSGVNVGAGVSTGVGCRTAYLSGLPFGAVDVIQRVAGGISVAGWALDPDTADPIAVYVGLDGGGYDLGSASGSRPDVGAVFPSYGSAHGFAANLPVADGNHSICFYAINVATGANVALRCAWISIGAQPIGSLDGVQRVPGGVSVNGWTIDPDTAAAATVHAYVDTGGWSIGPASGLRPDVAYYFPSYGPAHGYTAVVGAAAGWHTVCTYGIDTSGGVNGGLGCRSVYVDPMPFGALDSATASGSNIRFSGWAIDPDTAGPISIYVTVDGVGTNIGQASQSRPDVGAYLPAYGPGHGFNATVPATAGQHAVCAYALNVGEGSNVPLRCTTVTV